MKKQEMTVEERKAAIAELNSRQLMLQTKIDIAKDAEKVVEGKRREHLLALEDKASNIMTAALPEMPNAGKVAVRVCQYWSYGDNSKRANIKISRSDSNSYDFEITITNGSLSRYSAWSQSGDNADDVKETIAYYEIVSTLLTFTSNPQNNELLMRVCEIVNTPYDGVEERVTPSISDMQTEIREITAEIRKLQVYVGAKGLRKRIKGVYPKIAVVKVTPKKFYYRFLLDGENGEFLSGWDESAAIDDSGFIFSDLVA